MIDLGVSLYSFSIHFFNRGFDLEQCIRKAHEMGFRGVEIVAAQMIENYPNPTDEWCEWLRGILKKYNMKPLSYSAYIDMGQHTGRDLTEPEIMQCTINDIMFASRLGFPIVRTQHAISPGVLEKMIPYAKKWKVWIGVELHAPHNCQVGVWKEYFELFNRVGSEYIGVVPDMGIFQEKPEAAVDDLDIMLPHSKYIHGKFFNIDSDEKESSIPYQKIMQKLGQFNFEGFIAAEYEGHFTDGTVDCVEQLERYVRMMQRLISSIDR